jgi:hypothetical protein
MLTGADPALDRPLIPFRDVIEILHRSMLAVLVQSTFGFKLHNRRLTAGVLVGVDYQRRRTVCSAERFGSESARLPLHRV